MAMGGCMVAREMVIVGADFVWLQVVVAAVVVDLAGFYGCVCWFLW